HGLVILPVDAALTPTAQPRRPHNAAPDPPNGCAARVGCAPASNGFCETQDVPIWVLDVEVTCAPRPPLQGSGDGCATGEELVVKFNQSRDRKVRVEVLLSASVRTLCREPGSAFEMDDRTITRDAGVKVLVHEVAREPESFLVERQRVVQLVDEELRGRR